MFWGFPGDWVPSVKWDNTPSHTSSSQVYFKCTSSALEMSSVNPATFSSFTCEDIVVAMVANMISHITRVLPTRFCCYRIFLLFIRIFFIRMTLWNRKYRYYCLCFSFVTLYPSFITFFWQAYLFRWLQIAFLTLGNTNNAQFLRFWVLAVDVFFLIGSSIISDLALTTVVRFFR